MSPPRPTCDCVGEQRPRSGEESRAQTWAPSKPHQKHRTQKSSRSERPPGLPAAARVFTAGLAGRSRPPGSRSRVETPGAPPAGVCGSEAAALPRRLRSIPLATPRARPHRRASRLSARASAGCRVGNKGGGRGAHGGGAAVRPSFGARDVSGGGRGPCGGGGHGRRGRRGQRGPGLRLARAAERAAGAAARSRHEEERLRQAGASGWKPSVCGAREGRLGPEILRERDFQGDLEKPLCGAERRPALRLREGGKR